MAKGFQAKVSLQKIKRAPVSHVGYRGRSVKKGESFITTNPEEAVYYSSQQSFAVKILSGQLASNPMPLEDDLELEEQEEEEEEELPSEVSSVYEKADLKKLRRGDLLNLIEDDDNINLTKKDIPKGAKKKEIIEMILSANEEEAN